MSEKNSHIEIFGLVDCNNFFVSCERVFRPDLLKRPVVVLSNNDSMVISRSNEAKALGIKMGTPIWEIEKFLSKNNGVVCSSNYELYGDMSLRVMNTLRKMAPDVDVYSIDEAFLTLTGMNEYTDLYDYGKIIVKTVMKDTGIPVSVGIDNTKTLAKLCSHYAKKHPESEGVMYVETEEDRNIILSYAAIGDVWGIGRKTEEFLRNHNINSALQFTQCEENWVKSSLKLPGYRTWLELVGKSCIDIDDNSATKKQICTSRGFGTPVKDKNDLVEAVTYFTAACAKKLREQNTLAKSMTIFFKVDDSLGHNFARFVPTEIVHFPVATDSSLEITKYALDLVDRYFRENTTYKKAGVIITEIVPNTSVQQNLFDTLDRNKHNNLMKVMDSINFKYGQSKIFLATQGVDNKWKMRREHLSKSYTTDIQDIIEVSSD